MMAKCQHCRRRKAGPTWTLQLCAMGRRKLKLALCTVCDVALNAMVLRFARHSRTKSLMRAYRRKAYG